VSGPDSEGRIAYVEDHFFVKDEKDQHHQLKIIRLDGTADTTIFSRPGSAMWATTAAGRGEIGSHLALAPSGGRVAFLSAIEDRQMPGALLHSGKIEIWDVSQQAPLEIDVTALDLPMSWFPDGKRLAYVMLVPRDKLPESLLGLEDFGNDGANRWEEVPAVYVLDLETKESTFLHVGWTPIVSYDGRAVLIGGWNQNMEFSWRRMDLEQQRSARVSLPGDAGRAVAVPTEQLVLYWGFPTTGAPVKWSDNNSSLVGPKLMLTIKAGMTDSNQFQTVVSEIDPRSLVSFGRSE
jgi:hypothetical protein